MENDDSYHTYLGEVSLQLPQKLYILGEGPRFYRTLNIPGNVGVCTVESEDLMAMNSKFIYGTYLNWKLRL